MIVNNNVSNNVFSLVLARQRARICSGGLRPPNGKQTRRIAPQAPCNGGLRPPMGAQRDAATSENGAAMTHG